MADFLENEAEESDLSSDGEDLSDNDHFEEEKKKKKDKGKKRHRARIDDDDDEEEDEEGNIYICALALLFKTLSVFVSGLIRFLTKECFIIQ